jgi:hypothetical protein
MHIGADLNFHKLFIFLTMVKYLNANHGFEIPIYSRGDLVHMGTSDFTF